MKIRKKKKQLSVVAKGLLIILMVPISMTIFVLTSVYWGDIQRLPIVHTLTESLKDAPKKMLDMDIPEKYIPIYKEAAKKYEIPWTLLAAHHRIETKFSTMNPLLSPVGAEGHMQFMPCTFVGWQHPSCSGKGKGAIPDEDKTNPDVIAKYGGYGIDANQDGKADPYQLEDAMFSAANYLASSGAAEGNLEKAIFMYNHSDEYVKEVLYYYQKYEEQHEKEGQAASSSP
ncbi:lytic transglycosylase domain-containing protein [Paenisporosarcina antarctica]|uniref:Lytic transglycosylase domain-containing protein n=1 Tax=Paenisporosarcina antarctica TaxID=417367 RepID=A0A4P6ZZP4_9BACL|nr:lytic transglycosylase domain-containing protein [Paenisporosarcina antarctica]QBP41036.1 lytic transglycosylase domain-containing protein [Paenisporosarcina antarctica]